MDSDLFCEDYYQSPDPKMIKFIEEVYKWKRQNLMLYPNDVMNLLIETGNVALVDVLNIFAKAENKSLDITLPTCYIK
jgi:hypothetical protein